MTKRVSSRIPLWAALGTLSALVLGLFTPVGWGTSSAAGAETPTISVTGLASEFVLGQTDTFTVSLQNFTETDGTGDSQVERVFQITMSASGGNGTLTLKTETGISESPGADKSGAASIRFTGTLDAVNAAMAGMTYSATTAGDVTLSVAATVVPTVGAPDSHDTSYTAATPVRWAGNGHFYQYVEVTSGSVSWAQAKAASEARTLLGETGYLATLTSEEENSFVANEIDAPDIWIGASDDHNYISAFTDQSQSEGKWTWVTEPGTQIQFMESNATARDCIAQGTPVANQFNSWACGEPNNATHNGETENFAVTNWRNAPGKWNDLPGSYAVEAFLVEYSGFDAPESANTSASTTALAVPSAPAISTVTAGNQSLAVAVSVPETGRGALTNFRYSTDGGTTFQTFSPAQTTSPLTISAQSVPGTPALQNGSAYSVVVQAVYDPVTTANSNAVSGTPAAPRQEPNRRSRDDDDDETPATTPTPTNGFTPRGLPGTNNGTTTDGTSGTNALSGPFTGPNNSTTPPIQPIAFIGGQPSAVQTSSSGSQQLQVETGGMNLGFGVQSNQGSVTTGPGGSAELGVVNGGKTRLQGSGLQPGSSVQLFLPSLGPSSKPLAQIPVGPNGEFSGDVSFTSSPTGPAMPIGRHVLQVASVNADGERVVVEITVNIAQGDPSPELNRRNGVVPTLTPGQSLATEAGLPVPVTLTVDSSQKSTLIEGEGWTMGFTLLGGEGAVGETSDGGALMNLVRNSSAEVTGDGFMPGTRLDVFLFSEPTLLGSVTVDDSGAFAGEITIDGRDVPVGNHTLQIQGVGADGFVRASNLGVTVGDPVAVATSTEQAASSFLWWLIAIAALVVLLSLVTWWAFQRRSRQTY